VSQNAVEREQEYAEALLDRLGEQADLQITGWELVGTAPDTLLRVLVRVVGRPCLFGVWEPIWDEWDETTDPKKEASLAYLRWEEALLTGEFPHVCQPDDAGVTWLQLWEDW